MVLMNEEKGTKNPFQHTLNLPRTEFSIRANAQQKEPEILARWETENLCHKATDKNKGNERFVLHDGPPFANGHLHMGHALDYILKDIICKAKRMTGVHAPLVPGWDCHGLPIELKVTAEHGIEKNRHTIDRITFKKYCRDYVQHWIEIQGKELKEFGKLADYEHAYSTMTPQYEADILRALASFIEKGYIERKGKTVPWCASCQTVLAAAEIEYKDRKDPSIYVLFPFEDAAARIVFPYLFEKDSALKISFLVWTTTPWTLPLNRAVALNNEATYVVLAGKEQHQAFIVAKELADKICAELGITKQILCEADAVVFEGKHVHHPFIDGLCVPVILDETVLINEGTACLHSAPGCGPEDYLLGIKNNLEIFSPLSVDGKYTVGIQPKELEGMAIGDALGWVIRTLQEKGALLHKTSITHSYPHCWRCRNGLMFRATTQWFCDLQKHGLVKRALEALEHIKFIPDWGKNRLHAFISNRTEWCISRQRQWGVPIPALLCTVCEKAYLDAEFVRKVADHVVQEGIEFWDRITIKELVDLKILPSQFSCKHCGNSDSNKFIQERDTLDGWFDSGVSHYAVLAKDTENLGLPADLYLEASDQHRGWFQSSLLCGMVLQDKAPMKTILTHGYVVDERKTKMSKSLGNVIASMDVITKYSRDILRLWSASADYEGDVVISEKVLENLAEVYRKIRNTCRFLISNLYDFDIARDAIDIKKMPELDQYALAQLHDLSEKVKRAYEEYNFPAIVHTLNNYCTNNLSAQYLDILKDRLYVEKTDGLWRRSAQTVLYHILDVLTHVMAPILSFTAEEIADYYQGLPHESIHLQQFVTTFNVWEEIALDNPSTVTALGFPPVTRPEGGVTLQGAWNILEQVRAVVLKAIERKREENIVKHSLEAKVTMHIDVTFKEAVALVFFIKDLQEKEDVVRFFKDWFIVSSVIFVNKKEGLDTTDLPWLSLIVEHADGVKCPRCWQWENSSHDQHLCLRCQTVLK